MPWIRRHARVWTAPYTTTTIHQQQRHNAYRQSDCSFHRIVFELKIQFRVKLHGHDFVSNAADYHGISLVFPHTSPNTCRIALFSCQVQSIEKIGVFFLSLLCFAKVFSQTDLIIIIITIICFVNVVCNASWYTLCASYAFQCVCVPNW